MDLHKIKKYKNNLERHRLNPKLWDYSYFLCSHNIKIFEQFRNLIDNENKIKILDVGCGFKPWLKMFNQKKIKYIGIDVDREMSSADFISSADRLPFSDNEFDALIYSEILEHVENLPSVLKEMRRVANNNALIFISAPFVFPEHGAPFDFQRFTRYFFKNAFKNDDIIVLTESNSTLTTSFITFNLFIESSPFRIFVGFKNIVYLINNIMGLFIDTFTDLCFQYIGQRFKNYFYQMPIEFAMIIRIKK